MDSPSMIRSDSISSRTSLSHLSPLLPTEQSDFDLSGFTSTEEEEQLAAFLSDGWFYFKWIFSGLVIALAAEVCMQMFVSISLNNVTLYHYDAHVFKQKMTYAPFIVYVTKNLILPLFTSTTVCKCLSLNRVNTKHMTCVA